MATEQHPWLNKVTAGITAGLTVAAIIGLVSRHIWPDAVSSFLALLRGLFFHPFPAWVTLLAIIIIIGAVFLFILFLSRDRTRSDPVEVEGVLWYWYLFGGSLHLSSTPICPTPDCRNELTLTDEEYSPSPPFLARYPDRYATHAVCSRCQFRKTFDAFQSADALRLSVEKEIRRRLRTHEITPERATVETTRPMS